MRRRIKIKGKVCDIEAEHAKRLSRKLTGLILEQRLYPLLYEFDYERRWSFHTFLVLKPIDFVFIDRDKRITELKYGVRPFKFSIRPQNPVKYVLELPAGMGSLFCLGEKLKF